MRTGTLLIPIPILPVVLGSSGMSSSPQAAPGVPSGLIALALPAGKTQGLQLAKGAGKSLASAAILVISRSAKTYRNGTQVTFDVG
jgi:hypothetical protein